MRKEDKEFEQNFQCSNVARAAKTLHALNPLRFFSMSCLSEHGVSLSTRQSFLIIDFMKNCIMLFC